MLEPEWSSILFALDWNAEVESHLVNIRTLANDAVDKDNFVGGMKVPTRLHSIRVQETVFVVPSLH